MNELMKILGQTGQAMTFDQIKITIASPEQIRSWVPGDYTTLGTDGFGFSDTRPAARRYFNTDAESQVVAVLEALARDGEIDPSVAVAAAHEYRIDCVQAASEQTSDPGVA